MKEKVAFGPRRSVDRWVAIGRPLLVVLLTALYVLGFIDWWGYADRPVVYLLGQLTELAACVVLLWRPLRGALLAVIPALMTLVLGFMDADGLLSWLLPAVFAAVGSLRQVIVVEALIIVYAVACGLILEEAWDFFSAYLIFGAAGAILGYVVRLLTNSLRRGEVRVSVLSQDAAAIRGAERIRLAGELRVLVSDRLAQSGRMLEGAVEQEGAPQLRSRLEGIRVNCLDAVTRVRALVGMLREDQVAEGSDEAMAAPVASQVLGSLAKKLRAQGIRVSLDVSVEVDSRNLVTQLTIARAAEQISAAAAGLHPHEVAIRLTCPPGRTRLHVTVTDPLEPRIDEEKSLVRIVQRVEALGGCLTVDRGETVWSLTLELPDQPTPATLAMGGKGDPRRRWRRYVEPGVVSLVTMAVFFHSVWFRPTSWENIWEPIAYLAVLVLYWYPPVGVVPALLAFGGLFFATDPHLLPLVLVVLMGTWQAVRAPRRWKRVGMSVVGCAAVVLLSVGMALRSLEAMVAIGILSFGMLGFAALGHFLALRDAQQAKADELLQAAQQARVEERNLLARELHDVLAHHLSVILLQCMAYGESEEPAELMEALSRIEKSITSAEQELVLLTNVMSEDEVADAPALVRPTSVSCQLERNLLDAGFRPQMHIAAACDDLPPITQRTLTRVMQEGATNIMRYARRGSTCSFDLQVTPAMVTLEVSSLMPNQQRSSQLSLGYGLTGIRERVDLSGGVFHAGPENGEWVVRVQLPPGAREAEVVGGPSAYTL
ncbi:MAG: histidine kinase [Arachnia propionica]|uniref:sensor histidine kinase n=1 Tax=Arachnia propionica TaxID=1750 RepID=UPI002711D0F8|nr:histidine kinase [Arachnia propionica]